MINKLYKRINVGDKVNVRGTLYRDCGGIFPVRTYSSVRGTVESIVENSACPFFLGEELGWAAQSSLCSVDTPNEYKDFDAGAGAIVRVCGNLYLDSTAEIALKAGSSEYEVIGVENGEAPLRLSAGYARRCDCTVVGWI